MSRRPELPFYTQELGRDKRCPKPAALREAARLLDDASTKRLIRAGQLTLALIRPSIEPRSNRLHLSDLAAAAEVESRFTGVGVAAKFSFTFDRESIDTFYEGPAKAMQSVTPIRPAGGHANRWEELAGLMVSGPTTALLLYAEHDAPGVVRAQFGHWNIERNRDVRTIRGALGVDNYNNLTHGSDTPQAALRECDIIATALKRQAK